MTLLALFIVALSLLGAVGYVDNIVWSIHHLATLTPELIVSCIGIFFAPLGIIHGLYVL
jgi:hypothetical protein